MEEFEENQYLQYCAESLLAQYERKEYSDLRACRIFAQERIYRDFINAATNPDYKLKSKDYIDIIYIAEMAKEIRMDDNMTIWFRKLLRNNDFKDRLKRFLSDIEAQKVKVIAQRLETDESKVEYLKNNEPSDVEINWDRYIRYDLVPEDLKTKNISSQTEIYSEKREAYNCIQGFVGFGHDWEVKMRGSQIETIKTELMRKIFDENGKIKGEIILDQEYKDKVAILKILLRTVGRVCEVEENGNQVIVRTTSVLEKELDNPEIGIEY